MPRRPTPLRRTTNVALVRDSTDTMDYRTLARQARAGSDTAMNQLIEQVYPQVRKAVHRTMPRNRREPLRRMLITYSTSDLMQEIFIKVVTSLDRFTGDDEATMINYLGALVRNTLTDRLRYFTADRRDPRRIVSNLATAEGAQTMPASREASPSKRVSASEQVDLYRDVLRGFAERERRLLQMRIEGATPFAILAQELSYPSEDAARKAYNAARAVLLVRLQSRGVRC